MPQCLTICRLLLFVLYVQNLAIAGRCLRRIVVQAKEGYVRTSSVRVATEAIVLLNVCSLARGMPPPSFGDASRLVRNEATSPSIHPDEHYERLAEGLASLIDVLEQEFVRTFGPL